VQYVHLFPDGLLLPGPDFRSLSEPVIAMEWIDGPTLIEAVDRAARQREHRVLNALANSWLRAVAANREVDFSHGSLTGQNVMVDLERGPVFVDYDTAWWPGAVSLSKQKPPATYSHPRGVASAPERRDDFAALLIYTSLRALAIDPSLRDDFGDPPARIDGAILFSASDLASPNKSKLFERLRDLGDEEFQGVLGILREACRSGVDTVPPIDDAWQAARAAVVEVRTEPEPVVLPPLPAPPVAADASWFGVAPETDRDRQIAAFIEAVVERDPANVVELWPSVRQSPEVIPYAIQATNLAREFVQQRVAKAMDAGDDNEIVAAVEQAQALVIAVPPGARRAYRRALRTVDLRAGLIEALERDDRQQLSDMAVSGQLDELRGVSRSAEHAVRLAIKWQHLQHAIDLDSDEQILGCALDELLAEPGYVSQEDKARIALAHAKERVQFGKPLGAFQLVQEKLIEMATEITKAQLLCLQLARLLDAGQATAGMTGMAKANNSKIARDCARLAREILGGNGILQQHDIMRHMADIEAIYTFEGTWDINILIVGRELSGLSAFV
jgi:hypothetical protein